MSFEKDEYSLDVKEQAEVIRAFEGNSTNTMLLAMDGEEIATRLNGRYYDDYIMGMML